MSKSIKVICSIYDCYWNIGEKYRRNGNCASKKVTLLVDHSQCSHYIDRNEGQAKIAQMTFKAMGGE